MTLLGRLFRRVAQSDEERFAEELRTWAGSIPGTTRIAECPERAQARIAGVVRRVTLRPLEGRDSLAAVLYDGTGEVTALWTSRDRIPGMKLGTRMVLEGMLARDERRLRIVNPRYEFA